MHHHRIVSNLFLGPSSRAVTLNAIKIWWIVNRDFEDLSQKKMVAKTQNKELQQAKDKRMNKI